MIIQIEPWIDEAELKELKRVIDSTYITEGELTKEFEDMTRELTGARHAIAMTNGTMALFCCLKALGIGEGDEVIVPNLTFIATSNAVIMAGAKPIFCEIRGDTFCIDVNKAEALITPCTKAIIPVHLYGQASDMDDVMSFAHRFNLKVVEDAAQGVGVKFNGRHVGTFGDLGILSYYGNKTITCGEGGVVLTNDDNLARECYRLKNHGRDKKGVFIHEHIGYNFSFTEMQAAVGVSQMKKLPKIIKRKADIQQRYVKELAGLDGFSQVYIDSRSSPVFWFTSFLADSADELSQALAEKEIQTRRFFYPLHLQPCYRDLIARNQDQFELSEIIYSKGISLPSAYNLTDEEQSKVIATIRSYYE